MGRTIAEALEEEGALRISRKYLRMLLEQRFGAVPAALLQRIEAENDLNRLERALLQVLRLSTPEELQL